MNGPIALLDANILYDAVLRDLLMQIAVSGLFRPRWTARIHDEWVGNLLANRPELSAAQIELTKAMMERAVPDGMVEGYDRLIDDLHLPDAGDRHVLAAAIAADADVIVTINLKDFPREALQRHGIEAVHPDQFLKAVSGVDPEGVSSAAQKCRVRMVKPALSVERYLAVLERHGLPETVAGLRCLWVEASGRP